MDQKQMQTENATIFLKVFIKTLINETRTARHYRFQAGIPFIKEINAKGNFVIEDEEKLEFKNYLLEKIPSPILEREIDFLANAPEPPSRIKVLKEIEPLIKQEVQIQSPQLMPQIRSHLIQRQQQPVLNREEKIEAGLEKINQILSVLSVQTIECSGPDKPLIINNSGRAEPSKISLSKEEIQKVIKFFSEETKIPIITGVFKAILGNLTITAVVSDFVGTRFIIQKRLAEMQNFARRH